MRFPERNPPTQDDKLEKYLERRVNDLEAANQKLREEIAPFKSTTWGEDWKTPEGLKKIESKLRDEKLGLVTEKSVLAGRLAGAEENVKVLQATVKTLEAVIEKLCKGGCK